MSEDSANDLNIENLWDALLSRQAEKVRAAFRSLDDEQQRAAYAHLQRMAREPGWHLEQRLSAQVALEILEKEV
jgi:hypothetical protein